MGGATSVLPTTKHERIDSCSGEETSVHTNLLGALPLRRLLTSSKDSTDDKLPDICGESLKLSHEKQQQRLQTLYGTLCSIMQEPQERALYKAFLHTEYGIQIWDLWRCVEAYEDFKGQRLKSYSADVGLDDGSVLTRAEALYATYLAPNAKCFVDGIPASYSASIRDQLERGTTPDYQDLHYFLMRALCSEHLLMSFAKWLSTDEAKSEDECIAERFRREAGDTQKKDLTAYSSPSRLGASPCQSFCQSFRGNFDDLYQATSSREDSSTGQPHEPPESPAKTVSSVYHHISLTLPKIATDGVFKSARSISQRGCAAMEERRAGSPKKRIGTYSGSLDQDENRYKMVIS